MRLMLSFARCSLLLLPFKSRMLGNARVILRYVAWHGMFLDRSKLHVTSPLAVVSSMSIIHEDVEMDISGPLS